MMSNLLGRQSDIAPSDCSPQFAYDLSVALFSLFSFEIIFLAIAINVSHFDYRSDRNTVFLSGCSDKSESVKERVVQVVESARQANQIEDLHNDVSRLE
jgi:hypothetical protein